MCKERLANQLIVIYFQQNHYIANTISRRIARYREFGITNHIIERYIDFAFLNVHDFNDNEPKPLTMEDLLGIFGVWFCCMCCSLTTWLIEMGMSLKRHN